jgi:hypothetical protein
LLKIIRLIPRSMTKIHASSRAEFERGCGRNSIRSAGKARSTRIVVACSRQ